MKRRTRVLQYVLAFLLGLDVGQWAYGDPSSPVRLGLLIGMTLMVVVFVEATR